MDGTEHVKVPLVPPSKSHEFASKYCCDLIFLKGHFAKSVRQTSSVCSQRAHSVSISST